MNKNSLKAVVQTKFKEPNEKPHFAVAIIVSATKNDLKFLFIERAKVDGDHWSGDISFPGGKREIEDKDLIATAIRETKEEIGLKLNRKTDYLGYFKTIAITKRGSIQKGSLSAFVFFIDYNFKVELSDEVEDIYFLNSSYLLDPKNIGYKTIKKNNISIDVPGIVFYNHILWGMTYSLFASLVHKLDKKSKLPLY